MIWVDLDETLLHSEAHPVGALGTRLEFTGGPVWAACRPGAAAGLAALRELGDLRMLTTAIHAYAIAASSLFGFGFKGEEIIAREQWLEHGVNRDRNIDPEGILIDNASAQQWHRVKRAYLGISEDRLLTVPDYLGRLPDPWEKGWPTLIHRVRHLLGPKPG